MPPFCLTPQAEAAQAAAEGLGDLRRKNPVVKAARSPLRALQEMADELPVLQAQSFVNYASAPAGGQTYDANWLATNTAVR